MLYENIFPAVFIDRPNRFIANIEIDGAPAVCHVKNTGRCRELLTPGARIFVQRVLSSARRTQYDLISVYKGGLLINMDAAAPNKIFEEYLRSGRMFPGAELIRPETRRGDSRFDFYIECSGRRIFAEVKGVTLESGGVVRFPDAPTQRGVKHLRGLVSCVKDGLEAWAVFIVQLGGALWFEPNEAADPAFAAALREAARAGVNLLALDCAVTENSITAAKPVEIRL